MLIHAYRRKAATSVDTGAGHVEFVLNADGEAVAEVEGVAADVLLGIPEAYKAHATESMPILLSLDPVKFILKGAPAEGDTPAEDDIDLSAMSDDELKAFAKENSVYVHHSWTGDKLRQTIIDAFTV